MDLIPKDAQLLRVFVGETDRWKDQPLYEAIVHLAKREGMAGATVLKGTMGYGHESRVHTAKFLRLSEDLPIVIEMVDDTEKISTLIPKLREMMKGGLITVEKIQIHKYE